MATLVLKYSDYEIQTIEFFIKKIEDELALRDLPGLSNSTIDIINVTKQHPLVAYMAQMVNDRGRNLDNLRSGILPSISVTPGNMNEGGFTLGQGYQPEIVDDNFINYYKSLLNETDRTIQESGLISKNQIETLIAEYNRTPSGGMRLQRNEWRKDEDVNISAWSDSADIDILIGNLLDSIIAKIQIGTIGDNSPMKNLRLKITKGLTNFNFGRVLFGSEYNLTFTNTYNNFEIYTDDVISSHETDFTHVIPGE